MRRRLAALLAALGLLLTACAGDGEDEGLGEDLSRAGPRVEYDVIFEGDLDSELESFLRSASETAASADRPPPSELILRKRARSDLEKLKRALGARGYYEGTIDFEIRRERPDEDDDFVTEELESLLEGAPVKLVYEVDAGPQFTLAQRRITIKGDAHGFDPPSISQIGLKEGEPALAQQVIDTEQALLRSARENGHPRARLGQRRTVLDFDTHTMDVELVIEPGPQLAFAAPDFTNVDGISEPFLRRRIGFDPGDPYDIRDLEEARQSLIETNLFSTIRIAQPGDLTEEGRWPVRFETQRRPPRTIGAGVSFRTEEGPEGRVFWEHRNLFGAAERFRIEASASPLLREVEATLRKPDFRQRRLNLVTTAAVRDEDTDAFDSRSIGAGFGVEKIFGDVLTGTVGLAYRFAQIEDAGEEDTVGLFSIPASAAWDYSDSLLDPTEGSRLTLELQPFWDTLGRDLTFVRSRVTHTRYYTLLNSPRFVLAMRGSVGSIAGAERDEIPADERFYAGGGGSIRGIGFQLAGPLDDGEPLGGRSLLEGSFELRYRVLENVELVTFLDGGSVFEEVVPTFENDLEFGTGAGVRYLTPIGPLRFDVGVPIDRREDVDDAFQIYVSIGQAF